MAPPRAAYSSAPHKATNGKPQIVATYDYLDEDGELAYQAVRLEPGPDGAPKTFRQRRPDGKGGWIWNLQKTRLVLYRLPELLDSAIDGRAAFLVEGEKDVETLRSIGLCATTNAMGAGKWRPEYSEVLQGRDVFILPDNDDIGRKHAKEAADSLSGAAASVKIVELPGLGPKGDVSDWLILPGNDKERLLELVKAAKPYRAEKAPRGFRWEPIDSAAFHAADYRPAWLCKPVLVGNQATIMGAPQKGLKTSTAIDLAISMASGTSWLGKFLCPERKRVAVLSGESGPFTIQETARRICIAKGLDLAELRDALHWQFTLPQLASLEQLDALRLGLAREAIEVVFIDPLYLSLLAGGDGGVRAENLYETGPLLLRIAEACLAVGTTPVLLHHTRKGAGREGEPLDLTDLAFSGVAEFSRQWILLSRREAYEPGTGQHRLWLVVGGSVGHGGQFALDIDEGQLAEDFTGRRWHVTVSTGND